MSPRHVRRDRPRSGAWTLIELVVVLSVVSVVAGVGTGILVESGRAYSRINTSTDAFADARHALDRLATELANVADPTDLSAIAASAITFSVGGESRTYETFGSDLRRDSESLVGDVSAFALTYYGANGSVVAQPADVRRIAIRLDVTRNGVTAALRTEVTPRAFRGRYESWTNDPSSSTGDDEGGGGGILYVSRSDSNEDVDVTIQNTSSSDITFGKLTVAWSSPTAYFERLDYRVSGESEEVPWRYWSDPSKRWGKSETRSFNQSGHTSVTLPAGETAKLEMEDFGSSRYCGCYSRDMDSTEFTITFLDGSTEVGEITVPSK